MRLLVKLRSLKDQAYDLKYYHKLQGFIYRLLDETPYVKLHDRRGYKFFCFSNIFPLKGVKKEAPVQLIEKGEPRCFLISSPEIGLIKIIEDRLIELMENEKHMNVGEMSFGVDSISQLEPKMGGSCTLITGTPIVVRIPRENYEKYGIKPPKDYDCVYWGGRYSFEAFIKQLEDNLFKKYNDFYGGSLGEFPLFEQFMFKKQVCNHVVLGGKEVRVLGSIWGFSFGYLEGKKRDVLQFGLDVGFGEKNSLGFGFMNVVGRRTNSPS